jgi:hypothetical protein
VNPRMHDPGRPRWLDPQWRDLDDDLNTEFAALFKAADKAPRPLRVLPGPVDEPPLPGEARAFWTVVGIGTVISAAGLVTVARVVRDVIRTLSR